MSRRWPLQALLTANAVSITGTSMTPGPAAGSLNPVLAAVEYERIPARLQSRIFGVSAAGVLAGLPVGALAGGLAVEHLGLRGAFLVTGGLRLLATLTPVVWRSVWQQMDATRGSVARDHCDELDADPVADLQGAHHR